MKNLTIEQLADLLRDAKKAHTLHEKKIGRQDKAWPEWYARHILQKLNAKN